MNRVLAIFCLLLFICACSAPSISYSGKSGTHAGFDLRVWLDNQRTVPLDAPIYKGVSYFTQISGPGLWKIAQSISGSPVFEYSIDTEVLGQFVEAKATLERVKEGGIWDMYYFNLSTTTPEFSPGFQIRAENFQTAENDEMTQRLPAGNYLFRLYVYGTKDWDSQSIFVTVE